MSDEKKSFTVRDRRHFTVEGEARQDAPEERHEPEAAPRPEAPKVAEAPKTSEVPPASPAHVDFASFIISMAAQASALLEGLPELEGAEGQPDLEGARSIISVLEMLRDKTEGRRTPEEERVLETILYQLRMGYVAKARAEKA